MNNNSKNILNEPFHEFIKRAREEKDITQAEVQKYLKLRSSGAVTHWEKGRTQMTTEHALEYAKLLNISIEEIIFRLFWSKYAKQHFKTWKDEFPNCEAVASFALKCENFAKEKVREQFDSE